MADKQNTLESLSVEKKLSLLNGKDNWSTLGEDSIGLKSVRVADGPSGLRVEGPQANNDSLLKTSLTSVSFPSAALNASSFDEESFKRLGQSIAQEAKSLGIDMVLGPGLNIKRSPLGGRSFEYLSEDPLVSGKLAASYVKAVQQNGVGACLKHFAVNSQETYRSSISAEVDERALREIYLKGFQIAVSESQPWAIMASYNRINGVHSSDNSFLLSQVLRGEWGFKGLVMTDWGGMNDKTKAIKAGLDLEMPNSGTVTYNKALKAYQEGKLSQGDIDKCVRRLIELSAKCHPSSEEKKPAAADFEKDHQAAKDLAVNGIVLLKNDGEFFPLKADDDVCLVGLGAKKPRFQGEGSSHVNSYKEISPYEAFKSYKPSLTYAQGYQYQAESPELENEAISLALSHKKVIFFLADNLVTEGVDRKDLKLPVNQVSLLMKIAKVNPHIGVILTNGAPVEMPFINQIQALLECYLPGEAGGEAMADLAFGKATPSGKLAETFPLKKEDVPCDRYFPGGNQASYYQESLYIGYRYYETVGKEVLFPFGFGLSYAKFTYSQAELKGRSLSFYITNNGDCEGKETYFVFAKKPDGRLFTPAKELIAFGKVSLASGEKKLISLEITDQMLASYDPDDKKWEVENGEAVIFVASSAKDVKASFVLPLNGEKHLNPARKVPTAYENGRIENLSQADFASLLGRSPLPLNAVDPLKDLGEDLSFKAIADSNQAVQALLGRLAQDSNPTIAELLSMVPVRQYCLMLPEPVKIPFHEAFFQLCRGEKVKENSMVILKILQMLSSGGRKTDL